MKKKRSVLTFFVYECQTFKGKLLFCTQISVRYTFPFSSHDLSDSFSKIWGNLNNLDYAFGLGTQMLRLLKKRTVSFMSSGCGSFFLKLKLMNFLIFYEFGKIYLIYGSFNLSLLRLKILKKNFIVSQRLFMYSKRLKRMQSPLHLNKFKQFLKGYLIITTLLNLHFLVFRYSKHLLYKHLNHIL